MREVIKRKGEKIENLKQTIGGLRKELERERKLLEMWKEKQTVAYRQMGNHYAAVNILKEEKALLLNSVDLDFKKHQ
jgi:hypothetical protein